MKKIPESVLNVNGITTVWDVPLITYRTALATGPEIAWRRVAY